MLEKGLVAAAVLLVTLLAALPAGAAPTDPVSLLWPKPREVGPVTEVRLRLPLRVEAPAGLAAPAALMQREVADLFGSSPAARPGIIVRLTLAPELARPEEYSVAASRDGLLLRAHDVQGAFWAVHTLAVLLGQARRTADGYTVAIPAIRDWPDTTFRAFMIEGAWVSSLEDYRQTLKLLARQHITYVAMEFGSQVVLDFDPTIARGPRFSKAQIRELVHYARSLGLKPIGYLNLLGHLDRAYQKDPYTQHGGLDIQHDATYDQFVYPILSEMLDLYGPVEYFHCGMDEAWELFTWLSSHGADVNTLIARHITRVNDFLKARGVKLVIWHDMLLAPDLEKQLGAPVGPANGGPPQNTAGALALIPKDVILDYWFYDPHPTYPALDYLRAQGFTVWASPWQTPFSFVRYAAARQAPTLGTLWADPPGCFSTPAFSAVSALYAQATWNAAVASPAVQPEPELTPAAQRAVNAVLWRRSRLTFPSETALLLSPSGPKRQRAAAAREQSYGVPLDTTHPLALPPLPESSKPLTSAAGAARVRFPGGPTLALDGVNTARGEGQLILYAAPLERTGTNIYGYEVMVGADGKVLEISTGAGNHALPPGGFVLSAHVGGDGAWKADRLLSLHGGDRITVLDAQGNWLGGSEPTLLLVALPDGRAFRIDGDDTPRGAEQLVLYHPGYGDGHTGTNRYGVEVIVRAGKVAAVQSDVGNAALPDDGYVLSVHESAQEVAAALRALHPGDALRFLLERGGKRQDLEEALSQRATHLPVGAKLASLYLAMASDRISSGGVPFGEWQVQYANGATERIPARYGRELISADAASLPVRLDDPSWLVESAGKRYMVREWSNPHPELLVRELAFVPAPALLESGARILAATAALAP